MIENIESVRPEERSFAEKVSELAQGFQFERADAYTIHVVRSGIQNLVREHYQRGDVLYDRHGKLFADWRDVPVNVGYVKVEDQYELTIEVGY